MSSKVKFRMDQVLRQVISHYREVPVAIRCEVGAQDIFLGYLGDVIQDLQQNGLEQAAGWVEDIADCIKSCGDKVWGSMIEGYLRNQIQEWEYDYEHDPSFEMVSRSVSWQVEHDMDDVIRDVLLDDSREQQELDQASEDGAMCHQSEHDFRREACLGE